MSEKLATYGQVKGTQDNESNGMNEMKEALELIKKSIKGAVPVSVALGSIVTLLYCLRIGYLPIDGLESIATLGAAVALTAAIFLLSFFLLLSVPIGVAHWGLNGQAKEALTLWFFVKASEQTPYAQRPRLGKILALTVSVSSSSWVGLFFISSASKPIFSSNWIYVWIVGLAIGFAVILWYVFSGGGQGSRFWNGCIRLAGVVVWAGANVYALLPVVMWPSFAGLELDKPLLEFAYIAGSGLFLWCFYGIHLAVQLNPQPKKETPWTITLIFTGLLALMVLPAILLQPKFHNWLMNRTSVRMADVQLALKPEACATLRASGIPVAKSLSAEKADDEVVSCLLKEATVLLRIGERWQVSICEIVGANGQLHKFTLSSDDIASWTQSKVTAVVLPDTVAANKMCVL